MIKKSPPISSIARLALGSALALLLPVLPSQAADSTPPEPGTIQLDAKTSAKALKVIRDEIRAKGDADEQFWPSIHACEALTLAGHGDEVSKLLTPQLKTEKNDQHLCGLARELVRAGDRSKAAIMLDLLEGDDPYAHVHACESLYKVNEIGDGVLMREAMKSKNIKQALMAAAALGRQGNQPAMQMLREHLTNEEPEIARIAAWVLGRIGDPRLDIPGLRDGLSKQSDPLIKAYFQNALATLGDPRGITAVLSNLRSDDPAIRTYSATFAGDARITSAKDRLIHLLDDENIDVRVRAAQSLFVLSLPVPPSAKEDISREVYPASKKNPRYSEGSILPMPDGSLLYATTEFSGSGSDHAEANIISRRSHDGGRTWGKSEILQKKQGGKNVMSATLRYLSAPLRDDTPIALFYLDKQSLSDLKVKQRVSTDGGKSFGASSVVTADPGYNIMNNDRILRLSNGRLIAPISMSPDVKNQNHFTIHCMISDDEGKSWKRNKSEIDYPKRGAMEPEVIEFKDGQLGMIFRNQLGHIAITHSQDKGETWSKPESWNVPAPESPATLRRIPSTGDLLLVWNDNVTPGADHGGIRSPLTVAISTDDGKTWQHKKNIESGNEHTYSYISLTFMHGRAIMSYYVRDEKTKRISSRFRSLPIASFYQ